MEEKEFKAFYDKYIDLVYRIAYTFFKGNRSSTEDVCQDIFIKILEKKIVFENDDHARAWLIVSTSNACKNKLKHWWNKNVNIDDISEPIREENNCDLLDLIFTLPYNQRISIYLHYYEGYNAKEIGKIIKKNENTIFGYLSQGRELLRKKLGDDFNE